MFSWLEKLLYLNDCEHEFETKSIEQLDFVHIKKFQTTYIKQCVKCGKNENDITIQDYNDDNIDGMQ